MTNTKYRKLCSDTVILALGTFGSKLLVFLLMPLYTALLSPDQYSAAELITGTANLIMPFACMGITTGIFRFAAERGSDQAEVFSSGIALLGGGLGALTLIGLPFCFLGVWRLEAALILAYILFADVQAVCAQYVRAIDRTRLFAIQGILNTVLTILFNVLFLVVFDLGVTGYVLSVVVGNFLTAGFLFFTAKLWRVFRPSKVRRETLSQLFRFSLPMVPTTVCWLITDLSDRYFVNAIWGAAANGIYSAAYKIPTIVTLISSVFMQAWQFSAVAEASDEEACSQFYSKVFKGFLALVSIGTAGLIFFSRFLSRLLLDASYFEAWRYMPVLLCAAAVEAVVSFFATVYLVRKRSMHSFVTAIVGTVANLILNALLIPEIGVLGAAVATLISYCIVCVLRAWDVNRLLCFDRLIPRQILNFGMLFAMAAVMTFVGKGRLIVTGLLAAIILTVNLLDLWRGIKGILKRKTQKS
jgi:O-antigen/teichoic acid export membrane protein